MRFSAVCAERLCLMDMCEAALATDQARLRSMSELNPVFTYMFDRSGKLLQASLRAAKHFSEGGKASGAGFVLDSIAAQGEGVLHGGTGNGDWGAATSDPRSDSCESESSHLWGQEGPGKELCY